MVTGGGTGLGKSIATEFARLGASVGILSRDEEHRAAGVAAVEEAGGTALAVAVRHPGRRRPSPPPSTPSRTALGPIDVLVNNAAGNFPVPAEDMSPNAWRTVVDIVLNGTYLCCRDLARRLIPAGRDGAIVNVGASYAWTGGPGFAHSAAAKAGVKNLTETLAVEWAPYGIRVNGLVPGLMPHEDETAAIAAVPGKYEGQDSRVPAGTGGLPPRAGLGRHLPVLPLRHLHQWPLAGGRRGQLAAPPHRAAAVHPDPRAARPPTVRRVRPAPGPANRQARTNPREEPHRDRPEPRGP